GFEEKLVFAELSPKSATAAAPRSTAPLGREKPEPGSGRVLPPKPDAKALAVVSAYELDLSDAGCAELAAALTLGIRDYARKTCFRTAVLGLSGGVDSALTAVLAVRALGPDQVTAIAMPSRYTASMSNEDAALLSQRLGIGF